MTFKKQNEIEKWKFRKFFTFTRFRNIIFCPSRRFCLALLAKCFSRDHINVKCSCTYVRLAYTMFQHLDFNTYLKRRHSSKSVLLNRKRHITKPMLEIIFFSVDWKFKEWKTLNFVYSLNCCFFAFSRLFLKNLWNCWTVSIYMFVSLKTHNWTKNFTIQSFCHKWLRKHAHQNTVRSR